MFFSGKGKKTNGRKSVMLAYALIMVFSQPIHVSADTTDTSIFTGPIQNVYEGTRGGAEKISNLNYADVSSGHAYREAIVKAGALDMASASGSFRPDQTVSNSEAIAFILRAVGQEQEALAAGAELEQAGAGNAGAMGYFTVAADLELITDAELAGGLAPGAQATRENVAHWIVKAIEATNAAAVDLTSPTQAIYNFTDYESIDVSKLYSVEVVARENIMRGSNNRFNPKSSLTRGEMAQILSNMDSIYFQAVNLERKTGTVAGYLDEQANITGQANLYRKFYIRTGTGQVDIIQYEMVSSSSPQAKDKDVPVYKAPNIYGLVSLNQGEQIEYIVNPTTNEAMFVKLTGSKTESQVTGYLESVNLNEAKIVIRDAAGKRFEYPMVDSIYGTNADGHGYVVIDGRQRVTTNMPTGSRVSLDLINNVTQKINYVGEQELVTEIQGVVVANDPALGYITIIDGSGKETTKQYYSNINVEKSQYYDTQDEIGYIDEVFPDFRYDPRDTTIDAIEPGDIVYLRLNPSDPNEVIMASAVTNYIIKYGKVLSINHGGATGTSMLLEYENKQTSLIQVPSTVFVSEDGYPIDIEDVQPGDWVKALVNQAILGPGYIMESVKELVVEGTEHYITTIMRGQLAGIDPVQMELMLQNSQTLTKSGWSNYNQLTKLNLNNRDIEYYYNGNRISLDYAVQYLKRSNGETYVALENHFSGERVAMVTFRNDRDEILNSDTVYVSDGNGNFQLASRAGTIATDAGTIVRRYGRLTGGQNIMTPDYARVVLNGEGLAAIVDIDSEADVSGIMVIRGRIQSIDEGNSFQVQSMSMLTDMKWNFTPIERIFTIDYNTRFYNEEGYMNQDQFISYTDDSQVNEVYTILTGGSHADRVIKQPYATDGVRGTIYAIEGDSIFLKDASVYNTTSGKWTSVGTVNSGVHVQVAVNSAVVKQNNIITVSGLEVGDQVRVMTDDLPSTNVQNANIQGYLVFVER